MFSIRAKTNIFLNFFCLALITSCAGVISEIDKLPSPPNQQEILTIENVGTLLSECVGTKIHNRGRPNHKVVYDLIEELKVTPSYIFDANNNYDIYSSVDKELGPYTTIKNLKAVMGNVLIVLAGFESSWDYSEGRDMSARNTKACTEEAGLYQTSGNSNGFSPLLKAFQKRHCVDDSCDTFRACMKLPSKAFVHGHTIRLLRYTVNHHGPIKNRHIHPWLKRSCVEQIEKVL